MYVSLRNTRDFSCEIREHSDIRLHCEYKIGQKMIKRYSKIEYHGIRYRY